MRLQRRKGVALVQCNNTV